LVDEKETFRHVSRQMLGGREPLDVQEAQAGAKSPCPDNVRLGICGCGMIGRWRTDLLAGPRLGRREASA
jgi:hypothetical protein